MCNEDSTKVLDLTDLTGGNTEGECARNKAISGVMFLCAVLSYAGGGNIVLSRIMKILEPDSLHLQPDTVPLVGFLFLCTIAMFAILLRRRLFKKGTRYYYWLAIPYSIVVTGIVMFYGWALVHHYLDSGVLWWVSFVLSIAPCLAFTGLILAFVQETKLFSR